MADVRQRTCEACNATFEGRKRKFCYDCLVEYRFDPAAYAKQYNRLNAAVSPPCVDCGGRKSWAAQRCWTCYQVLHAGRGWLSCKQCGESFLPRKGFGGRRWCSEGCTKAGAERVCVECGAAFMANHQQRWTCSMTCGRQRKLRQKNETSRRRRVRHKGRIKGAYHHLEIFDRDGWRCGICHQLTRPWHRAPHPLSPTIDHILPIAAGGADVPSNVQCAHYKCNIAKGHRPADDQMRMVG